MNKHELVHLHGLLVEVTRYCRTADDVRLDLERYRAIGTHPHAVHHSKAHHEAAVVALLRDLTTSLGDESRELEAAPAAG